MESSTLAMLSPELRNEVYSYLLPEDRSIEVYPCGQREPGKALQPPITRVCRQIRNETIPMFYGNNYFVVPLGTHHHDRNYGRRPLLNSISQARAWLRCNPPGKSPMKHPLIITLRLNVSEEDKLCQLREPWVMLALALKHSGYSEENCIVGATICYGKDHPHYVYPLGHTAHWLKSYKTIVEKIFSLLKMNSPAFFESG